jgi:riboflavin transporter FmnP
MTVLCFQHVLHPTEGLSVLLPLPTQPLFTKLKVYLVEVPVLVPKLLLHYNNGFCFAKANTQKAFSGPDAILQY